MKNQSQHTIFLKHYKNYLICFLVLITCLFVLPSSVFAAACTGLPSIGSQTLSNCTLTVAGITGSDFANNIEVSTANTAILTLNPGAAITINAGGTLATGSIRMNGGTIAIASTGTVKPNTPLFVADADGDGWASTALSSATLFIASASGKRRLSLMRGTTADCGDSTYQTGNICCTANGGACSSDGTCCSSICGTNTDADGYFSQAAAHTGTCQASALQYTDCNDSLSGHNYTLAATYYPDLDLDGYTTAGVSAGTAVCSSVSSWNSSSSNSVPGSGSITSSFTAGQRKNAANGSDCNDTGTSAANVWISTTCYVDSDHDGYGSTTSKTCMNNATCTSAVWGSGGAGTAATNVNFAANTSDCNDGNASLYRSVAGYLDNDGDTYGVGAYTTCAGASGSYVADGTDCYDANNEVYPGSWACRDYHRGDGSFDWDCDTGQEACNTTYYNYQVQNIIGEFTKTGKCGSIEGTIACATYPVNCAAYGYSLGTYYAYCDGSTCTQAVGGGYQPCQ